MQTITVRVENDALADKIKAILSVFKNDGVETITQKESFEVYSMLEAKARINKARNSKEILSDTEYETEWIEKEIVDR